MGLSMDGPAAYLQALCNVGVNRDSKSLTSPWFLDLAAGVLLFLVAGYALRACWALAWPRNAAAAIGLLLVVLLFHTRLSAAHRRMLNFGGGDLSGSTLRIAIAATAALVVGLNLLVSAEGDQAHRVITQAQATLPGSAEGWVRHIFYFLVYAPIIEELAARGWIQGGMSRVTRPSFAVLGSAAMFAVAHSWGAGQLIFPIGAFLSGILFGICVIMTRSVWAAVALHATANALNTALLASGAHRALSEVQSTAVVLGIGLAAAGGAGFVRLYRASRRTQASVSAASETVA